MLSGRNDDGLGQWSFVSAQPSATLFVHGTAFQIVNADVDLSQPQRTSQGLFWHNLHVVLVHRERWMEVREETLCGVRDMIVGARRAKGYLLSRAGILPDHVHLALGCPIDVAPVDVALGFLNNLAFVHGMRPVYQFGGFIGTLGEKPIWQDYR